MCLILFSYKSNPNFKLVIAANRDEFYNRPTSEANFWKDHSNILGGRDLQEGGTWMGVTKSGKLSMLTNYRDLSNLKSKAPTRGKLVSNFLVSNLHPSQYLDSVDQTGHLYNGFNILLGSIDDLWYYSNISGKKYMLGSGVYGLSNALLDTAWPKVMQGKTQLDKIISKNNSTELLQRELLKMLSQSTIANDDELPDTGVGIEMERMLSPLFIKSPKYGTRCSTVLIVDQNDHLYFLERTYNIDTNESFDQEFSFRTNQVMS